MFIHSSDFLSQVRGSEDSTNRDHNCIQYLNDKEVELRALNNQLYKVYGYNGRVYDENEVASEIVSEIVEPIRQIVTIQKHNMCFIAYGEKTSGKSTILGTLPTFSDNEDNICFYTLVTMFNQIELDRSENRASALNIVAFEIFVDQIIDLTNDSYQESKYN